MGHFVPLVQPGGNGAYTCTAVKGLRGVVRRDPHTPWGLPRGGVPSGHLTLLGYMSPYGGYGGVLT